VAQRLTLSGALAGLGGINFVLGYKGYYEDGFTGGAGFLGIAVRAGWAATTRSASCSRAFFFATLSQGGLAINAMVAQADRRSAPGHRHPSR